MYLNSSYIHVNVFFYFPIEINADTIDFSIKLEKDNKLAASGKALYIFVY